MRMGRFWDLLDEDYEGGRGWCCFRIILARRFWVWEWKMYRQETCD